MTQVTKFDPSTLMQGVRDRIKSEFVGMIPDEQWQEMVQKEIDDFFKPTDTWGSNREYKSPFQLLCRNVLSEEAKDRLKSYLSSPEFSVIWDTSGQPICTEEIKRLIIDNSGAILAAMMGGMFSAHLQNFASSLRNTTY